MANSLNDKDGQWWPLLFLRPKKHEQMTSGLVALVALAYGVTIGVITNVLLALVGAEHMPNSPLMIPALASGALFALYRSTLAVAWNRRAARMARVTAR